MTENTNIRNILKQVSITIREVFQFSYNLFNNNSLYNYQNSYNQIPGKYQTLQSIEKYHRHFQPYFYYCDHKNTKNSI